MIKYKKISLKIIMNAVAVLLVSLLVINHGVAQKSSGVLDSGELEQYTSTVEKIDDTVTQGAANAGNAVRFLLRPIREADISPNMTGIVSKIHFNVGQRFKKGNTLISMQCGSCLLYTSPSPRDQRGSRMPSSA